MSASNDISDLCLSIWLWQDWIKYYGKMCQVIFSRFVWQPLYFCCRVKSLLKKKLQSHTNTQYPLFKLFTCSKVRNRHFSIFKQDLQGFATLPSSLCPSKKEQQVCFTYKQDFFQKISLTLNSLQLNLGNSIRRDCKWRMTSEKTDYLYQSR